MADLKAGESFGLDAVMLAKIDWSLAIKRIQHNLRSDFIYAPHLTPIYGKAGEHLVNQVKGELNAGKYSPGVPVTIEVPKSFRIRVSASKRLGPSFSRPGSILLPHDRLLYQALADQAATIIDAKTNHKRSFSHRLASKDSAEMFLPTRKCWSDLQKALSKYASEEGVKYILKIDVANFFGSINLHTLINVLSDSGYAKPLSSRLEAILISYTGERSSRGILQGMYPSDLFGNFYLAPIDRFFDDYGVASARYVDDMYIFVESVDAADRLLRGLIAYLRTYDLVLNEAKCVVMPKSALITEEPDLEELFNSAVEEISEQVEDGEFSADYGFQSEWDDGEEAEEIDEEDLELQATKVLFDSIEQYPGHEENIERFCLPLFATATSDYALEHVMTSFKKRPSMSQMYVVYLAKFLEEPSVSKFLFGLLGDESLTDWQKMWVVAALIQLKPTSDAAAKAVLKLFKDANNHDALRAIAAIYVGRYGDLARRKELISTYPNVGPYIQASIYFSSRYWPGVERLNAKASWGGHGELNKLLTTALANK